MRRRLRRQEATTTDASSAASTTTSAAIGGLSTTRMARYQRKSRDCRADCVVIVVSVSIGLQ